MPIRILQVLKLTLVPAVMYLSLSVIICAAQVRIERITRTSAPHPYRIFNTWMGDPGKLILLERVLKVIQRDNLISLVNETGKVLKDGLMELQSEFPNVINSVRGRGTFLAFNACNTATRDRIQEKLKCNGVLGGSCGDMSIRLRPSLVFAPKHAEIYLDRLAKTLKEL